MLDGKAALITGAAGGIGEAICRKLLEKNVKVCLVDMDDKNVKKVEGELKKDFDDAKIISYVCDITSEKDFEDAVVKAKTFFGHLDILINNAGIVNEKDYRKLIDINLLAVMIGTELAVRYLTNKKGERQGTVINTSSICGFGTFIPFIPAYNATKHGVLGWSRAYGLPEMVKETGIKVNAVCPDVTNTKILPEVCETSLNPEAVANAYSCLTGGHKYLTPSEVAQGFIKVLEDDVTGEVLVVSIKKGVYYLPATNFTEKSE